MRGRFAIIATLALAGCQSVDTTPSKWERIGPGPNLEVAAAQCDNASMGQGGSQIAIGSPSFVAGAAIGGGIRRRMAEERYRRNCMVMLGWKRKGG